VGPSLERRLSEKGGGGAVITRRGHVLKAQGKSKERKRPLRKLYAGFVRGRGEFSRMVRALHAVSLLRKNLLKARGEPLLRFRRTRAPVPGSRGLSRSQAEPTRRGTGDILLLVGQ